MIINPISKISGELSVPGDKSISHRAIMFSSLSDGKSIIRNFLQGDDCLSTIRCFKQLGINIIINNDVVEVEGNGLHGLKPSVDILDVGNSGTTLRLMTGILSAQAFDSMVTGDSSIQKRPMKRVMDPLSKMGAKIESINNNGCAPLKITGQPLKGITYESPVSSAQVKSSILLAGLYADGKTTVIEPAPSRNHTEIMLEYYGGTITTKDLETTVEPVNQLKAQEIIVPGDISSAAFLITAALIVPNSRILIKNVGINPTRNGILEVYRRMNANIQILNERLENGEPVADILAETSTLKGIVLEGDIIPNIIDEIPIISVAAAYADGQTIVKNAEELKVKESNRIDAMVENLSKMNVDIVATDDGMIINGNNKLKGATVESYHDHRIAMSLAIATLSASGSTTINDSDCIAISYPGFFNDLEKLSK
ncbi:3-phosphoshikimate 1-carboxyvinyltransferase [Natranaerovirga pectinivora]|uniref:3-phosphoshikimate 1-carboxyvinyltransferase n=1 Tax=Natranaerovirga pectinivora TaxID=682400 RepID=A0A4R3ML57_9FIRM|nr:3-phosphoshikimate 1-carboxyvinyltransferase [Natranaerovirga pectinivora]TCT15348.1 3-phosphoshikimate 1-carboxyvinyltransferase [Natranaerovirga pectinivora]